MITMWTDPLTKFYGWQRPITTFYRVCKASGMALVHWPSGRTTTELYAGTAIYTEMDAAAGRTMQQKQENLVNSLKDFRNRTSVRGWWIRERRGRKKARRILMCVWMNPDDYAYETASEITHAHKPD